MPGKPRTRLGRLYAALLALLVAVLGIGFTAVSSNAASDFSLTAGSSVSIMQGKTVDVPVAVTSANSSPVNLSATGLSTGLSASFSALTGSGPVRTCSMTLRATSTALLNVVTIKVVGTSPISTQQISVVVTVLSVPPLLGFTLGVNPNSRTVLPTDPATYAVSINRGLVSSGVTLSTTGLPAGTTTTFVPQNTLGNSSTLTVRTSATVTPGVYPFTIKGDGTGLLGVLFADSVPAMLVVNAPLPFTISGNPASTLSPGASAPIDLTFNNPNSAAMSVTGVQIAMTGVSGPNVNATPACTTADFAVVQYSGTYPIPVPGAGSRLLSTFTTPDKLPRLTMVYKANANQDACKGASVSLSYTGTGQGGTP